MSNNPSQIEMFEVPSPCIGVCETGPRGFCLGCYRSREERLYWQQVDDATRRIIVKACYRRKRVAMTKKSKKSLNEDVQEKQHQLF